MNKFWGWISNIEHGNHINNMLLYIWKTKRKDLKFLSLPTKNYIYVRQWLTNLTVVIVLQYTHIKTTNVHLKLTNFILICQLYLNKAEGKKK